MKRVGVWVWAWLWVGVGVACTGGAGEGGSGAAGSGGMLSSSSSAALASSAASTGSSAASAGASSGASGACANVVTDPDNCGWCGHACVFSLCTAALCDPVNVAGSDCVAQGMASTSAAYVVYTGSGLLLDEHDLVAGTHAHINPGTVSGVMETMVAHQGGLVVSVSDGLWVWQRSGGTWTKVRDALPAWGNAFRPQDSIAVHNGWAYFLERATSSSESTKVWRVSLGGGATQLLGTAGFATRLFVDAETLYASNLSTVWSMPIAGGTAQQVLFGNAILYDVTIQGNTYCGAPPPSGSGVVCGSLGQDPHAVVPAAADAHGPFLMRGGWLYAVTRSGATYYVDRYAIDGGGARHAGVAGTYHHFAADGSVVLFASPGGGCAGNALALDAPM